MRQIILGRRDALEPKDYGSQKITIAPICVPYCMTAKFVVPCGITTKPRRSIGFITTPMLVLNATVTPHMCG